MGRELEFKYRICPTQLSRMAAQYPDLSPISMETIYYDTPAGDLTARHWTLRRRMENGHAICTVKIPLPDGSRGEWETAASEIGDAIQTLCALGAPRQLLEDAKAGFLPSCGARFTRLATLVTLEQATVELALDQGVLLGGGKELPFAEVEVEHKRGSDDAAGAYAAELSRIWNLQPEPRSKFARAKALAEQNEGAQTDGI